MLGASFTLICFLLATTFLLNNPTGSRGESRRALTPCVPSQVCAIRSHSRTNSLCECDDECPVDDLNIPDSPSGLARLYTCDTVRGCEGDENPLKVVVGERLELNCQCGLIRVSLVDGEYVAECY